MRIIVDLVIAMSFLMVLGAMAERDNAINAAHGVASDECPPVESPRLTPNGENGSAPAEFR